MANGGGASARVMRGLAVSRSSGGIPRPVGVVARVGFRAAGAPLWLQYPAFCSGGRRLRSALGGTE